MDGLEMVTPLKNGHFLVSMLNFREGIRFGFWMQGFPPKMQISPIIAIVPGILKKKWSKTLELSPPPNLYLKWKVGESF